MVSALSFLGGGLFPLAEIFFFVCRVRTLLERAVFNTNTAVDNSPRVIHSGIGVEKYFPARIAGEYISCEREHNVNFIKHGVSQEEIEVFFEDHDYIKHKRRDGSFAAMTRLESGRYLKVVYRQKAAFYFIITAYDLESPKEIHMVDDFLEDL